VSLRTNERTALRRGILFVLGLTLWRVILLIFDRTELFVDEAQYWFWGQNLDFGYYSKPPLIAWIIRAVTDLAGSDSPFWVRLPAPLFHMGTALVLMAVARRLYGLRAAAWAGPVYVTLPMVSVGAALFSTDTPMLFFHALAILLWLKLQQRTTVPLAAALGFAVGLGLMAKYAMIYFVLGAGLAGLFIPAARIPRPAALIAAAVALAVIAPNIWWNIRTGGITIEHMLYNAEWHAAGAAPGLAGALRFLAEQFVVFGPIMFAAYLLLILRTPFGLRLPHAGLLLWLSAPVTMLMAAQGTLGSANANWGVAAYTGASVLVTAWLLARARALLWLGQGLHLLLALALPILTALAPDLRRDDGRQWLHRYLGRAETSQTLARTARENGLDIIVSASRDLAADLHYTLRERRELKLYALPRPGFPASYYEQRFPVPPDTDRPVLLASLNRPPACATRVLARWTPQDGALAGRVILASLVAPDCLKMLLREGLQ